MLSKMRLNKLGLAEKVNSLAKAQLQTFAYSSLVGCASDRLTHRSTSG